MGKCWDADSDGLPDWWEINNFGNLGQTGSGDTDGDGLSNFQEYTIGTNPNRASVPDSSSEINLQVFGPLK